MKNRTLTWKPLSTEHIDLIFETNSGNVAEYFYDFKNRDEVETWVIDAIEKQTLGTKLEYVIFEGDDFIGMISPSYPEPKIAEIGMWLCVPKQGQGYGRQVLSELIDRLKNEGVEQVIYTADEGNLPSRKLAESLNFKQEKIGTEFQFTKIL